MARNLDRLLRDYIAPPPGMPPVDFAAPAGAPALFAPDSVSWRVMKNPVALIVGGLAAVILELAEPRVRTGVWEHTSFRRDPETRMRRTVCSCSGCVRWGAYSRSRPSARWRC